VRTANNVLCGALALAAAINIIDGLALSLNYLISYYLTIVLFYTESYNLVPIPRVETDQFSDDLNEYEPIYRLYPDFPLVFQNILFAVYTLFGAWFWQNGILNTHSTACEEQAAIVFLFSLRNPKWINAATVLGVIFGTIFVIILLIHLKNLKRELYQARN
jgi:hypothetical protein